MARASGLGRYAIFPGQVIGVVGVNAMGHTLKATRIIQAPLPAIAPSAVAVASEPFNVLVAAGPFSCTGDLSYAPLKELLGS